MTMDAVSQAILEVCQSADSPQALNIVHPRPITWASIISSINEALVQEGVLQSSLPIVDMQTWVDQLKEQAKTPDMEILSNIVSPQSSQMMLFTQRHDFAARYQTA